MGSNSKKVSVMFSIMPQLTIKIIFFFRKYKRFPNIKVNRREKHKVKKKTLNWMILAEFLHLE